MCKPSVGQSWWVGTTLPLWTLGYPVPPDTTGSSWSHWSCSIIVTTRDTRTLILTWSVQHTLPEVKHCLFAICTNIWQFMWPINWKTKKGIFRNWYCEWVVSNYIKFWIQLEMKQVFLLISLFSTAQPRETETQNWNI